MKNKTTFIYGNGINDHNEVIIKEGYVAEEMLTSDSIITFEIGQSEVLEKSFERVDHLFSLLQKKGKEAYGIISLTFGYDFDNREIYEIKEVCDYMKSLSKKYPYLFYYLVPSYEMVSPLVFCLGGVKVTSKDSITTQVVPIDLDVFVNAYYLIALNTLKYGLEIDDEARALETLKALNADRYINLDWLLQSIPKPKKQVQKQSHEGLRRSHEGLSGIKKDSYPGLPEELKPFNFYYNDENGHVIMAIPEALLNEAEQNGDLDMLECPFPCKYVLTKGYRIYKDHIICRGKYDKNFGLDIDESWYET